MTAMVQEQQQALKWATESQQAVVKQMAATLQQVAEQQRQLFKI